MKREALKHPKTLDLMARLGINRREAVGLLDLLFDWAIDYAPQGDIGKWSNGVIAGAVEWDGGQDELVAALVASKWLDEHGDHRLIIHDWPEHAPNFLRAKLKKTNRWFLKCYESKPESELKNVQEPTCEGNTNPFPSPPLPSNQTAAALCPSQPEAAAAVEVISANEWDEARPIAQRIRLAIKPEDQRLTTTEREWAAKIAVLTRRRGNGWLAVALEGVKNGKPTDPKAYMHTVLDGECQRTNSRLNRELALIDIPEEFLKPRETTHASQGQ